MPGWISIGRRNRMNHRKPQFSSKALVLFGNPTHAGLLDDVVWIAYDERGRVRRTV